MDTTGSLDRDDTRPLVTGTAGGAAHVLKLPTRRILRYLMLIVAAIFAIHLSFQLLGLEFYASDFLEGKVDVDRERSVPTYLASALLTVCGLLSWWLARVDRLPWPGWGLLAFVFLAAGIDEVAGLHEELSEPIRSALDLSGWLSYAWVIVGAGLALAVSLAFLRTFLALPSNVRMGLALGAGLFLLGAIGMELPGSHLTETVGTDDARYVIVSTLEEALEFAGVFVWIHTLLGRLRSVARPPTLLIAD